MGNADTRIGYGWWFNAWRLGRKRRYDTDCDRWMADAARGCALRCRAHTASASAPRGAGRGGGERRVAVDVGRVCHVDVRRERHPDRRAPPQHLSDMTRAVTGPVCVSRSCWRSSSSLATAAFLFACPPPLLLRAHFVSLTRPPGLATLFSLWSNSFSRLQYY